MNPKILITGASGFVGFHLTRAAKQAGMEVHAAVRRSSTVSDIQSFVDRFVYLDFEKVDTLRAFLATEDYTFIVHAAAMTRAKQEDDLIHINSDYTERLAEAAFSLVHPVKRFVFVSSLAAIGPVSYDATPIDEYNDYHPVTSYGRSKAAAEKALDQFKQFPLTIVRPTAVYGPREKDLYILFQTLNKGIDAYIGRSPQKLSFIYVEDLVQAILNACLFDQGGRQVYNLSDGKVYDRYKVASIFSAFFHKKLFRLFIPVGGVHFVAKIFELAYKSSKKIPVLYPERISELTAANWSCDISRARQRIQFEPKDDLVSGLTKTLTWYKTNKWL